MSKISVDHLSRAAYVYIRQSTMAQVQNNHESQRRQYALRERARLLGWQEVTVVDEDLGRSGSGVARPGFDRLLTAVGRGEVGAVFAIEASRLARNGRDWHTLLEFCAIVGTLIIDEDGIYDPRSSDDQMMRFLRRIYGSHWGLVSAALAAGDGGFGPGACGARCSCARPRPDRAWHRARRRPGRCAPLRGGLRPSSTTAARGASGMIRPGRRNGRLQPNRET
jgi:hypothetical protein